MFMWPEKRLIQFVHHRHNPRNTHLSSPSTTQPLPCGVTVICVSWSVPISKQSWFPHFTLNQIIIVSANSTCDESVQFLIPISPGFHTGISYSTIPPLLLPTACVMKVVSFHFPIFLPSTQAHSMCPCDAGGQTSNSRQSWIPHRYTLHIWPSHNNLCQHFLSYMPQHLLHLWITVRGTL